MTKKKFSFRRVVTYAMPLAAMYVGTFLVVELSGPRGGLPVMPASISAISELYAASHSMEPCAESDAIAKTRANVQVCVRGTAWQNSSSPQDVNGNGMVGYLDYELIKEEISRLGNHKLPQLRPANVPYLDANGDGFLSNLDALAILNYLRMRQSSLVIAY